nr:hypothetical protein [uncultured Flavobacterium sp.]
MNKLPTTAVYSQPGKTVNVIFIFQSKFTLGKTVNVSKLPSVSKPLRYAKINMQQVYLIATFFLMSCGMTSREKSVNSGGTRSIGSDSSGNYHSIVLDSVKDGSDLASDEYASYHIVIVDTAKSYNDLLLKMTDLSLRIQVPIDSMGRFFDPVANLIKLPDNDEDEIYAGDYFPRRVPSETLSIEYLNLYKSESGEKTMALVAGVYEDEKRADSAFNSIIKIERTAFKIKSDIYIGCLH